MFITFYQSEYRIISSWVLAAILVKAYRIGIKGPQKKRGKNQYLSIIVTWI